MNSQDEVQRQRLVRSILARCAEKHGGVEALAEYLGVKRDQLIDWVGGSVSPPVEIVQKAVQPFLK